MTAWPFGYLKKRAPFNLMFFVREKQVTVKIRDIFLQNASTQKSFERLFFQKELESR